MRRQSTSKLSQKHFQQGFDDVEENQNFEEHRNPLSHHDLKDYDNLKSYMKIKGISVEELDVILGKNANLAAADEFIGDILSNNNFRGDRNSEYIIRFSNKPDALFTVGFVNKYGNDDIVYRLVWSDGGVRYDGDTKIINNLSELLTDLKIKKLKYMNQMRQLGN